MAIPAYVKILLICIWFEISASELTDHGLVGVDWNSRASQTLKDELKKQPNTNVAKNIILFIGDGLGLTTTTASRIYKGQKGGGVGEMSSLAFEDFPNVGLSKTFSNDMQVTGSASASGAMLSGTKMNGGTLGVNPKMRRGNCSLLEETKVSTIMNWCMDAGKGAGVVTTTRITHATPASVYAHSPDRYWETDADVPAGDRGKCRDIAYQLIMDNPDINVILGGGRRAMLPDTVADPENPANKGLRTDNINLIQEWIKNKQDRGLKHNYVWKEDDFKAVDHAQTDFLLGLFGYSHMQYELERADDEAGEPSLAEMTEKAIRILRRQPEGFFLMVEGGRIDHAHHDNYAKKALEDTLAFDEAVTKAIDLTDDEDTLIIVTADHSHPFSMASWASVNNPILGVIDKPGFDYSPPVDGEDYLTLSYSNGPGPEGRFDVTGVDSTADNFQYPVQLKMTSDTHAGDDVAMYARGPMSHLINGVKENQYIAHVMAYAACVGKDKSHCADGRSPTDNSQEITCGAAAASRDVLSAILMTLLMFYFFSD